MLSCFVIRQIKYNASLNYTNLVLVNGRTYLQISLFFIGNNGGSISIKSQNARLELEVPLYSQLVRMYSNQISKLSSLAYHLNRKIITEVVFIYSQSQKISRHRRQKKPEKGQSRFAVRNGKKVQTKKLIWAVVDLQRLKLVPN